LHLSYFILISMQGNVNILVISLFFTYDVCALPSHVIESSPDKSGGIVTRNIIWKQVR